MTGLRFRIVKAENRPLSRQPLTEPDRAAWRLPGHQELSPQIVKLLRREDGIPRKEAGDTRPGQGDGGRRTQNNAS